MPPCARCSILMSFPGRDHAIVSGSSQAARSHRREQPDVVRGGAVRCHRPSEGATPRVRLARAGPRPARLCDKPLTNGHLSRIMIRGDKIAYIASLHGFPCQWHRPDCWSVFGSADLTFWVTRSSSAALSSGVGSGTDRSRVVSGHAGPRGKSTSPAAAVGMSAQVGHRCSGPSRHGSPPIQWPRVPRQRGSGSPVARRSPSRGGSERPGRRRTEP